MWLLLNRTRWGMLVRAATLDREMVASLGVNQSWLFTTVFFLGSFLAGLGGALQVPACSVNLLMDLSIIAEAFVVVVIGGMGSIPGAFVAALLIGELNAFGVLVLPQATIVLAFVVMAVVLVIRPYGLFGKQEAAAHAAGQVEAPIRPASTLGAHRLRWTLLAWSCGPAIRHRRVRHGAGHRHPDLCAVCRQPAFHHGQWRHGVVRPCGLFRPRLLMARHFMVKYLRRLDGTGPAGRTAVGGLRARSCSAGSACACRASTWPC